MYVIVADDGPTSTKLNAGGVSGYWDATYGVYSLTYTTLQANGPSQVIVPPPKARVTLFPWVRASRPCNLDRQDRLTD